MADSVQQPLTCEQDAKFRQLWTMLLKIFKVIPTDSVESTRQSLDQVSLKPSPTSSSAAPKRRSRLGSLLRSSPAEPTPQPPSFDPGLGPDFQFSLEDDKWGWSKDFQSALTTYTPQQLQQIFWTFIKNEPVDHSLLRYLRARKWDVSKALIMLISTLRWRMEIGKVDSDIIPRGDSGMLEAAKDPSSPDHALANDFLGLFRLGFVNIAGVDKKNQPICLIRVRLHKIGAFSQQAIERYTIYLIETGRLMAADGTATTLIFFDLTDFGLINMDYNAIKFIIQAFEANYPETLGDVIVHRAPWIFSSMWSLIKSWMDPNVAKKVHFTKNNDELNHYIDQSQRTAEYGGTSKFEYKYIEPQPNENAAMKDTAMSEEMKAKRTEAAVNFEKLTVEWLNASGKKAAELNKIRVEKAKDLSHQYWNIDPFVRARSVYDRAGQVHPSPADPKIAATITAGEKASTSAAQGTSTKEAPHAVPKASLLSEKTDGTETVHLEQVNEAVAPVGAV